MLSQDIIRLDTASLIPRLIAAHSEQVTPSATDIWTHEVSGEAEFVRYRLVLPELVGDRWAFIAFRFSLQAAPGAVTHISIVNHEVNDGCLWEIQPQDCCGVFTLHTVLKPPLDSITLYITLKGAQQVRFALEEISACPLAHETPLRIAMIIDPWVERGEPDWKNDYIWWLGRLDNVLRETGLPVESHYVMGDQVAAWWPQHRPHADAGHSVIPAVALSTLYGAHRAGLIDQRNRADVPDVDDKRADFIAMLRASVPFSPDVIIAISDMQVLKDAFPESLILYRDALYCRAPFPDELTSFDPKGLYSNSGLAALVNPADQVQPSAEFIDLFFPKAPDIAALLAEHGLKEGSFLLLAMQDTRHINFFDESSFGDQLDMLLHVLSRFPDRQLVAIQHPDHRELSASAITALRSRYPNFIYIEQFEAISNPTARVLPFAGEMLGLSTGLLFQAMLLGKPVHFLGRHALADLGLEKCDQAQRRAFGWALLRKNFASYHYLHNPHWLLSRFAALTMTQRGALQATDLAVDLPGNIERQLRLNMRSTEQSLSRPSVISAPAFVWDAARQLETSNLRKRIDLLSLVRPGGIGVELGVAEAEFSTELLERQHLSHLYSIDAYAGDRGHDDAQYRQALAKLAPHRTGNTLIRMRFEQSKLLFDDAYFDFVYVDGYAHDGQLNGRTFEDWYPKLRPGGVMAGHDYMPNCPLVIAAVDQFAARHGLSVRIIQDESGGWNAGAASWYIVKPMM